MTLRFGKAAMAVISLLASQAHAQISSDLFNTFSRCDATFFKQLALQSINHLDDSFVRVENGYAWIQVPSRTAEGQTRATLPSGITLGGLPVLEYLDDIIDLGKDGLYLTWGFVLQAQPEQVQQALAPYIYQNTRLKPIDGSYVRVEVKRGNGPWTVDSNPVHQAVGLAKTEKVFQIEADDEQGKRTLVSCSLQGKVTPDILREIRPDIPASQYPQP